MFAATDGGVVWLEQQVYTLEKKAAVMQATLPRHDRHGTAICNAIGHLHMKSAVFRGN
jgi:hypothetical protein